MTIPVLPSINKAAAALTAFTVGGFLWISLTHYLALCVLMGLATAVQAWRHGLNPVKTFAVNTLLMPLAFYRGMTAVLGALSVQRL